MPTRYPAVGGQPHDHPPVDILESQARERNTHLGEPTLVVSLRGNIPERVPIGVQEAACVAPAGEFGVIRDRAIAPYPGRVGGEPQCGLVVVICVQDDGEKVVRKGPIPVQGVDPHFRWVRVVHAARDVQVFVVVCDANLGALGRRHAEGGLVHYEREGRNQLPRRLVAQAVQDDGSREPRQRHRVLGVRGLRR